MAKIVPEKIIDCCFDCSNHEGLWCMSKDALLHVLYEIPDWYPLDNAPEPKDYGEVEKNLNISYREYLKRTGEK